MAEPLTLRYNNPGAVEYSPWMSRYGATLGPGGRYASFPTPDAGYGVMSHILDTYRDKHGLNTVSGIINRWAPSSVDNNSTGTYIANVSRTLGIDPNAPLTAEMRPALMRAMAGYEAGKTPAPMGLGMPPSASPASPAPSTPASGATPMTPATPYDGLSPEDVAYRRRLAQTMMQQGTSAEPVGHWTQALARALQGGMSGLYNDQAREGEKAGRTATANAFNGLASGAPPNIGTLMSNPWTSELGGKIAMAQYSQNTPDAQQQRKLRELQMRKAERDLTAPTGSFHNVPAGGHLVYSDPRTGASSVVATGGPKPLDSTTRKAIYAAQDELPNLKSTIDSLKEARDLVEHAYTGMGSVALSRLHEGLLSGISSPEHKKRVQATTRLDQLLSMEAITSMSATLKGATTDREMDQFKRMIADPGASPARKKAAIESMLRRAESSYKLKVDRIRELGGTMPDFVGGAPATGSPSSGGTSPGGTFMFNPATGGFEPMAP